MKRLILISALLTGVSCYAQNECNSSNSLFRFDNAGMPKEIHTLGSSPEFPFLRNMSSSMQVAAAIRRNEKRSTTGMSELDDMLMAIGFANGAKDVTESNVSMYIIPYGTEGNMGSGNYTAAYCKLDTDPNGTRSWKITSGTGCSMYVLAKCGNAFYPKTEHRTACLNVPVTLTGDMKEVTLNSSGQKNTTTDDIYVYYKVRKHRKHAAAHPYAEISDPYPSTPILLSSTNRVEIVPETYKVTVNSLENNVTVCPDSTLNLTANINVEKTSEYSGYYPAKSKTEYKRVSKKAYKMAARKMRKVERKENKIARRTGVTVNKCYVAK